MKKNKGKTDSRLTTHSLLFDSAVVDFFIWYTGSLVVCWRQQPELGSDWMTGNRNRDTFGISRSTWHNRISLGERVNQVIIMEIATSRIVSSSSQVDNGMTSFVIRSIRMFVKSAVFIMVSWLGFYHLLYFATCYQDSTFVMIKHGSFSIPILVKLTVLLFSI